MKIDLNVLTIFAFLLIANGIFASIILAIKTENRIANRYLSALSLVLSLWIFDTLFRVSGIYGQNPNFYFLPIYFSLGFGPLTYFYTIELTSKNFSFSYKQLLHFIPVSFQFFFYIVLRFQDYSFRRDFWLEVHRPYSYDIELALSFISLLVYFFLSRNQIKIYKYNIENSFSDLSRITLKWLNQLHLALFILSFFWLLETAARLIWGFYPVTPFSSITIGIVLLLIAIGGIIQKDLTKAAKELYVKKELSSATENPGQINQKDVDRILKILKEKELFLIPDLTLSDFSEHVGLSPRDTSRLVNKGLNISFIDLINKYRINRFKELVMDKRVKNFSLLGIAYESGFNSKSTFNRVFKKMEGLSPSNFINKT